MAPSHRNENDSGATPNVDEHVGDVAPPIYDDGILAESGGGMEASLDPTDGRNQTQPVPVDADDDDESPPLNERATAGSSPLAPANTDAPAAPASSSTITATESPDITWNANATCPGARIEFIEDFDGPDQPSAILADSLDDTDITSNRAAVLTNATRPPGARIELIEDIDGDGPDQPPAMLVDSLDAADIISKKEVGDIEIGETDVELPPRPFDATEFDDEDATKKKKKHVLQPAASSGEDSSGISTGEEMDDEVELHADGGGDEESPPAINGANTNAGNPNACHTEDEEGNVEQVNNPESTTVHTNDDRETCSTYCVPEAELVSDTVYDATPLDPPLQWWKQKQAKCFFVFMAVVLAAGVTAFVVLLSSKGPTADNAVNAPSTSIMPSYFPTTTAMPSSLPSMSSPPSACIGKKSLNPQKIDLPLDDPQWPEVAVDEGNMVVAVRDGDDGGPVFVIFHSLATDGWQRVNTFSYDNLGRYAEVAISGKMAFAGFRFANDDVGDVVAYEQNQFGVWEEVEDPFVHDGNVSHSYFGSRVGIDGDLAYVAGSFYVYIFRHESNKWVEIDRIDTGHDAEDFSISGYTIAIHSSISTQQHIMYLYKYMPDLNGVVSIQDPIFTGSVYPIDLSNNYLVYWDGEEEDDAFIYRREETNQTFVFHQQLKISRPRSKPVRPALNNDILVLGGDSSTHIFSEQNGNWEETITFDQRYDGFSLSGRQLLATTHNHEVYAYNIQDCAQEMPTQTPTSSQMPITSPTTSHAPTLSFSPTELCYQITIAVDYDKFPSEISWELQRVVDDGGDDELFKSHEGLPFGESHSQPICLQKGEWKFVISDAAGNGLCCQHGEGYYNVTSNGSLIAEGGEFMSKESTTFLIPFIPAP